MDMSFANQALVGRVPRAQRGQPRAAGLRRAATRSTSEIARLKLERMGIAIDTLTDEQRRYLASWEQGT